MGQKHKRGWILRVVGVLLFALLNRPAHPEVLSEHDRQDTALKAAMQYCRAAGGTWEGFDWAQTERVVVSKAPDGYDIRGSGLHVICKIPETKNKTGILVTWKHATTYMDGTPLPLSRITGYRLNLDGEPHITGVGTVFKFSNVDPGIHSITLQTMTADDISPESPEIVVTL